MLIETIGFLPDYLDGIPEYAPQIPAGDMTFRIVAGMLLSGRKGTERERIDIYQAESIVNTCASVRGDWSTGGSVRIECCNSNLSSDNLSMPGSYREINDLKEFCRSVAGFAARFWISEARKRAYILVGKYTPRSLHVIAALLPRYMPWVFHSEPLTQDEKNFLSSILSGGKDDFLNAAESLARTSGLREKRVRTVVQEYIRRSISIRRERLQRQINQLEENMRAYSTSFLNASCQKRTAENELVGLMHRDDSSSENELIEFLVNSKQIHIVNHTTDFGNNTEILDVQVLTYLEIFDPEIYDILIKNAESEFYREFHHRMLDDVTVRDPDRIVKRFFDALFSEESTWKLRMSAGYSLDIGRMRLRVGEWDNSQEYHGYMPNPHLFHFSCLGDYEMHANQALSSGDIVGALVQCVASAQSVNFAENITLSRLVSDLAESTERCIEFEDHSCHTVSEAISKIIKEDA